MLNILDHKVSEGFFNYLLDVIDNELSKHGYNVDRDLTNEWVHNNVAGVALDGPEKAALMPDIEIYIDFYQDELFLSPLLEFPKLDQTNMQYADSIEYKVSQWHDLSKSLTKLAREQFYEDDYTDEENY